MKVAFEFDPPTGKPGAAIAGLFGDSPAEIIAQDLASFKEYAERELTA